MERRIGLKPQRNAEDAKKEGRQGILPFKRGTLFEAQKPRMVPTNLERVMASARRRAEEEYARMDAY